eukprot:g15952.t1
MPFDLFNKQNRDRLIFGMRVLLLSGFTQIARDYDSFVAFTKRTGFLQLTHDSEKARHKWWKSEAAGKVQKWTHEHRLHYIQAKAAAHLLSSAKSKRTQLSEPERNAAVSVDYLQAAQKYHEAMVGTLKDPKAYLRSSVDLVVTSCYQVADKNDYFNVFEKGIRAGGFEGRSNKAKDKMLNDWPKNWKKMSERQVLDLAHLLLSKSEFTQLEEAPIDAAKKEMKKRAGIVEAVLQLQLAAPEGDSVADPAGPDMRNVNQIAPAEDPDEPLAPAAPAHGEVAVEDEAVAVVEGEAAEAPAAGSQLQPAAPNAGQGAPPDEAAGDAAVEEEEEEEEDPDDPHASAIAAEEAADADNSYPAMSSNDAADSAPQEEEPGNCNSVPSPAARESPLRKEYRGITNKVRKLLDLVDRIDAMDDASDDGEVDPFDIKVQTTRTRKDLQTFGQKWLGKYTDFCNYYPITETARDHRPRTKDGVIPAIEELDAAAENGDPATLNGLLEKATASIKIWNKRIGDNVRSYKMNLFGKKKQPEHLPAFKSSYVELMCNPWLVSSNKGEVLTYYANNSRHIKPFCDVHEFHEMLELLLGGFDEVPIESVWNEIEKKGQEAKDAWLTGKSRYQTETETFARNFTNVFPVLTFFDHKMQTGTFTVSMESGAFYKILMKHVFCLEAADLDGEENDPELVFEDDLLPDEDDDHNSTTTGPKKSRRILQWSTVEGAQVLQIITDFLTANSQTAITDKKRLISDVTQLGCSLRTIQSHVVEKFGKRYALTTLRGCFLAARKNAVANKHAQLLFKLAATSKTLREFHPAAKYCAKQMDNIRAQALADYEEGETVFCLHGDKVANMRWGSVAKMGRIGGWADVENVLPDHQFAAKIGAYITGSGFAQSLPQKQRGGELKWRPAFMHLYLRAYAYQSENSLAQIVADLLRTLYVATPARKEDDDAATAAMEGVLEKDEEDDLLADSVKPDEDDESESASGAPAQQAKAPAPSEAERAPGEAAAPDDDAADEPGRESEDTYKKMHEALKKKLKGAVIYISVDNWAQGPENEYLLAMLQMLMEIYEIKKIIIVSQCPGYSGIHWEIEQH